VYEKNNIGGNKGGEENNRIGVTYANIEK